jgi:hypothetical protein
MTTAQRIELAKDQLSRVLGFFGRVDSKASVVLAIDTAMLAFLVAHAPPLQELAADAAVSGVLAIICLAISLWYLYRGGTPDLQGGQRSLVYFREIAARTETNFVDEYLTVADEAYLKDLLGQVWRNSCILSNKFNHLEAALRWVAIALAPWLIALALFPSK